MFTELDLPKREVTIQKPEKLRIVLNIMEAYDHLFYTFGDTGVMIATHDEDQLDRLNELLSVM